MDVRAHVTEDGGRSFGGCARDAQAQRQPRARVRSERPGLPARGCDGGLYESWDLGETWKYVANLPVTQFYKVDVDYDEPFYNIIGGTQDNATQHGPSRTDNSHGIRNSDWMITVFGDGHQPAIDPTNPDIIYSQWQQGNLVRHDRKTGEITYIQPQPRDGEESDRFNWDAPILISPHDPARMYFASQRVWRSDEPRRLVGADQRRSLARHRPADRADDGPGVELRRDLGPLRDVPVRDRDVDRGVAEAGGPDLRGTDDGLSMSPRTAGRPGAGGAAPGRARVLVCQRHQGRPARRRHGLHLPRQPQGGRLHALRPEEHGPWTHMGVDPRRPARPAPRLAPRAGSHQPGSALPRHRVRRLLHRGRRDQVDQADRGRPEYPVPRPGDPATRERSGRRDLRPGVLCPR
jgi:hypothetical protein